MKQSIGETYAQLVQFGRLLDNHQKASKMAKERPDIICDFVESIDRQLLWTSTDDFFSVFTPIKRYADDGRWDYSSTMEMRQEELGALPIVKIGLAQVLAYEEMAVEWASNIIILSKENYFHSLGRWLAWVTFEVKGHNQAYKTSLESLDGSTWDCTGGISFADTKIGKKDITQELDDQISGVVEAYERGMLATAFNAALNKK